VAKVYYVRKSIVNSLQLTQVVGYGTYRVNLVRFLTATNIFYQQHCAQCIVLVLWLLVG